MTAGAVLLSCSKNSAIVPIEEPEPEPRLEVEVPEGVLSMMETTD
jgi:hypothetical protein